MTTLAGEGWAGDMRPRGCGTNASVAWAGGEERGRSAAIVAEPFTQNAIWGNAGKRQEYGGKGLLLVSLKFEAWYLRNAVPGDGSRGVDLWV